MPIARSSVEGHTRRLAWCAVGLGHRGAVAELPERYPPFQTRPRRFQQWVRSGILEEALRRDWRGACMSADSRTWTRRSWMPPSRGPKGGLRRRPHCAKDSEVQNGRSSFFILGLSREDCSCKQLERSGVAQGKPSRHNLFERARFDIFGPSTDAVSARGHPCSCGG